MRLLVVLLSATLLFAQDKPKAPNQEGFEAEIIPVKTLTGDSFNRLVSLLQVFGANCKGDSQLRTIVVYAPKDVAAQMRRMVEQLDRPGSEAAIGRNIDMTLTLLRCSTKSGTTAASLPADLEGVARQLRAATQYKDIQLWDIVPLRVQEGREAFETLRLPGAIPEGKSATASIRIRPEGVYRKDQGRYVRFDRLDFEFQIPSNGQGFGVALRTSGDFMEGQKTVLGKVSGISEEDAIFVVIALKVLD